ncbi:hypothetical protein [Gelidibacter gilvus]|uniref:Uncharacterized protein n=1 Tax=Gelidibacter gilvus TaxID=59602 RepID=A0A4V1LML7_9FLAO|nr:hypothetical protein [Gelidibacter gilvus]RXJ45713.1 hypothetical protein ESZ48_15065 [Gelidibacter gilvus]
MPNYKWNSDVADAVSHCLDKDLKQLILEMSVQTNIFPKDNAAIDILKEVKLLTNLIIRTIPIFPNTSNYSLKTLQLVFEKNTIKYHTFFK